MSSGEEMTKQEQPEEGRPRKEQRDIEEGMLRRDMEEHPEKYDAHKGIEPRP